MIKIYYTFLLLCTAMAAMAQNDSIAVLDTVKKEKTIEMKLNLRVAYVFPNGVGDNVLAKANEGNYGINFKVNVVEFYRINLGVGFEFLKHDVTDQAMAGNIKNSNLSTFFIESMYRVPVFSKLTAYPKLSVGYTTFTQRTGNKDYGQQQGATLGIGFNLDYEIAPHLEVFGSMAYNMSHINVNTHYMYQDYYGTLEQLNFALGLKFNILN